MTNHVMHTNQMLMDLKQQYRDRIDYLEKQIQNQSKEIDQLHEMINLLSTPKEYDV